MATLSAQDNVEADDINLAGDLEDSVVQQPEQNVEVQDRSIQFTCVDPTCELVTQKCQNAEWAHSILNMHMEYMHPLPVKEDKGRHSNKIVIPEQLDLDPSEDNYEEYQVWAQRFTSYLGECGADKSEEKLQKLIGRLSF